MNLDLQSYNRYSRLAMTPLVLFAINGLFYLINPESAIWNSAEPISISGLVLDFCLLFFFAWLLIETSIRIAQGLEKRLSWVHSPLSRFVLQSVLTLLASLVIIRIQDVVFSWIYPGILSPQESLESWQFLIVHLVVALLVSIIHSGYYVLNRWQKALEETMELRVKTLELQAMALQVELQSLNMQLDPHFLFNNFSTLSELILDDQQKATLFLEKLSKVYRYMIQNRKQELVQVKDEVAFVKAYFFLIQIRHGEQVAIRFDIEAEGLGKWIPPISLQLLIENAIKHNRATREEPLFIHVYQQDNLICVFNNSQPLLTPLPSTGLGLENIKNRFKLLTNKVPRVVSYSDSFLVELPLLSSPIRKVVNS